jgi:hypothetical protein
MSITGGGGGGGGGEIKDVSNRAIFGTSND